MTIKTYCQELYFTESFKLTRSLRTDSLTKFNNGELTRFSCGGGRNYYITKDEKVAIPNLYELTIFNLRKNNIDTVITLPNIPYAETGDKAEYLLSFDMTRDNYFYYELAAEIYRLEKNECKLFRLKRDSLAMIEIPDGMNFINFDISPNGNKMAFAYTDEKDKYNIETLFVLDFNTHLTTKIDTSYHFGFDINEKFTFWENDNLFYLKNGIIFKYDFHQKDIHKIEIPTKKSIDSFVKLKNYFYVISDEKLWQWNGQVLMVIYEPVRLNYISTLRIKE